MGGIFISYRRHDSAGWTGHLAEKLEQCFGPEQIFMDIEKIEAGTDFVEAIESAVSSCTVLLAVIGPAWLAPVDADGRRRLDNAEDYIRLEIATALSRNIRLIPVLVGGAVMPGSQELPEDLKALTRRQAHELTDSRWDFDSEQLVTAIEKAGIKRRTAGKQETAVKAEPLKLSVKAIASICISALLLTVFSWEGGLNPDMKIGGLVFALAALILGVFALFDTRLNKARGKAVAITAISFSGLLFLAFIGELSTQDKKQIPATAEQIPPSGQQSAPPPTSSPQQVPSQPVYAEPAAPRVVSPPAVATNIAGFWAGSDGLTYSIQQQGNILTFAGGYPNQVVLITGTGIINGQNVDLDYIRVTDSAGGKASFRLSADSRTLQGEHLNMVTGEAGVMILRR